MDDPIKQESKQQQQQQQQQSEISSTAEQQYRTSDLNINFLSQIYEILRCLEKETQENFVSGSNVSKEEQLQTLRSLRQQLIMKKDLLLKYKNSSFVDHLQSGISSQQQSTNNNNNIIKS
ncbi:hypothetical protein DERP_013746 [Dermatophagoides pteronyssinus]|uniref:Mediator of RNA polymerase II transcription subunit 9 n=1 Tax=Dermatophagoides pteronyssinus TaxID=6956 RepID=A0ABQ8JFB8_DERPT|nr:hypothetical protein DERP_013746 [Dermatophagoides pteronyssinus]